LFDLTASAVYDGKPVCPGTVGWSAVCLAHVVQNPGTGGTPSRLPWWELARVEFSAVAWNQEGEDRDEHEGSDECQDPAHWIGPDRPSAFLPPQNQLRTEPSPGAEGERPKDPPRETGEWGRRSGNILPESVRQQQEERKRADVTDQGCSQIEECEWPACLHELVLLSAGNHSRINETREHCSSPFREPRNTRNKRNTRQSIGLR
jgi:hypothetical protein